MPEAADNNAPALALLTDLARTPGTIDLDDWFATYALSRYGGPDRHAAAAWQTIRDTAYNMSRADSWSEAPDGLFGARPSLTANKAAARCPEKDRYDTHGLRHRTHRTPHRTPGVEEQLGLPVRRRRRGPAGSVQPQPRPAAAGQGRVRGRGEGPVRQVDRDLAALDGPPRRPAGRLRPASARAVARRRPLPGRRHLDNGGHGHARRRGGRTGRRCLHDCGQRLERCAGASPRSTDSRWPDLRDRDGRGQHAQAVARQLGHEGQDCQVLPDDTGTARSRL